MKKIFQDKNISDAFSKAAWITTLSLTEGDFPVIRVLTSHLSPIPGKFFEISCTTGNYFFPLEPSWFSEISHDDLKKKKERVRCKDGYFCTTVTWPCLVSSQSIVGCYTLSIMCSVLGVGNGRRMEGWWRGPFYWWRAKNQTTEGGHGGSGWPGGSCCSVCGQVCWNTFLVSVVCLIYLQYIHSFRHVTLTET